ncbi:MAG: site-2 protease family protein [Armatimonadetes bacterium]|nr:site-2 protease family protein [Armatimonadota bacterium]
MEALSDLLHYAVTAVVIMAMLTVIVIAHELGHYLFARMFGMHVNAFAVMMGGVRKTDLREHLERPMAPAGSVWLIGAGTFVVMMAGALAGVGPLYTAGLAALGIGVPLWVMLRQGALYHMPVAQVLGTWAKSILVAGIVLAIGTRFQGLDVQMIVGVAIAATLVALIFVYYAPVRAHESSDERQGMGQIEVPDEAFGKRKVEVRFRPLWCREGKNGTEFSLLLLPLGGFAAIKGMHPKADGSEIHIEQGFYSKPAWQRWIVLFAGPVFSVVFGLLVLVGLYTTTGIAKPSNEPVIDFVSEGSGADHAGLLPGDRILQINGRDIDTFYDVTIAVRDQWDLDEDGGRVPRTVALTFERSGEQTTVEVVPTVDDEPLPILGPDLEPLEEKAIHARIGVRMGTEYVPVSFGAAVMEAVESPVVMVSGLAGIVTGRTAAKESVAGPAALAGITSQAVKQGAYYVIWVTALLSISLGVMNLLPVVPLDGGQMVVAFAEMLRGGRRLSLGVQTFLSNLGLGFIFLLMLSVAAIDLGRKSEANRKQAESTDSGGSQAQPAKPGTESAD